MKTDVNFFRHPILENLYGVDLKPQWEGSAMLSIEDLEDWQAESENLDAEVLDPSQKCVNGLWSFTSIYETSPNFTQRDQPWLTFFPEQHW